MTRSMSGLLPVTAALLLAACSDPTEAIRGSGDRVVTNPSVLVVDLNGSQTVDAQLLDEQGTPLAVSFSPVPADPSVASVVQDTTFRPGLGSNRLTQRFIVSGLSANATTVRFAAGGRQFDLPVIVNPSGAAIADLSANALAVGDPVTITVSGNVALGPTTTVTFRDSVSGQQLSAVVNTVTATTINVTPIPGAKGPANLSGVTLPYAPAFGGISIVTGDTVDVPAVLNIPANFSDATPDINASVTASAPGFKFLPNVVVQFNGVNQPITAIAADSSSVTFRAANAGSGVVTFQNVVLDFLTSAALNLPSVATVTPTGTVITLTGTDAIITAPSIGAFGPGQVVEVSSGGAFNASTDCSSGPGGADCHIFAFTLTADATFVVTSSWNNNSDIGVYFSTAANDDVFPGFGCDQHGPGGGGSNFETCSVTLTAGTYYMQFVSFTAFYAPPNDVDPTAFTLTLTGQ